MAALFFFFSPFFSFLTVLDILVVYHLLFRLASYYFAFTLTTKLQNSDGVDIAFFFNFLSEHKIQMDKAWIC